LWVQGHGTVLVSSGTWYCTCGLRDMVLYLWVRGHGTVLVGSGTWCCTCGFGDMVLYLWVRGHGTVLVSSGTWYCTCGAQADRQNMANMKGRSLQLFFASPLKGRMLPFPFRVVSLGETQSLKPVVRIHTLGCLLEQSPAKALARILRPLLTTLRG